MTHAEPVDFAKIAGAVMRLVTQDPQYKVGEAEVRGNTYRVFENAPASLVSLFEKGAAHRDRDFILYEDEAYSFEETWRRALQIADTLKKDYGVKPGDRVAIAMRNYPEWCFAYMGVIALGGVVAPLNAWWKTEELAFALKDCEAQIVFVDGKRLERLKPVREEMGLTLILARDVGEGADAHFDDVLAAGAPNPPYAETDPDADFCILYTSGSTGRPKGVILTHRSAVSAIVSWAFLMTALAEARGGVSLLGDNPGILMGIPLFHVTGSHSNFMLSYYVGRRMAMMFRWDPDEAVEMINKHKITNFVGVPSQSFDIMMAAGDREMPSLLDLNAGGAKRPPAHVKMLRERFANTNLTAGYGLTETNAAGCINSMDDYFKRPDSTGRPTPPLIDLKIELDNGEAAPVGEVGEVLLRGPIVFRGYLNMPEETAAALTSDGWFRTGDLGRVDAEGFLYVVDRKKDLIIRGGENISCLEVEARAYEHSDIAEATVFSVPDDALGERVGMVVFPKEGVTIDPKALRDFIAADLAEFKVPERIWIAPAPLPRLATAKIDKRTARSIALEHPPAWTA